MTVPMLLLAMILTRWDCSKVVVLLTLLIGKMRNEMLEQVTIGWRWGWRFGDWDGDLEMCHVLRYLVDWEITVVSMYENNLDLSL